MDDDIHDVAEHFRPLWKYGNTAETEFPQARPLIAHYSSLRNLESIIKKKEFWFSNPLYANDYEELQFGLDLGKHHVFALDGARAGFHSDAIYHEFLSTLETLFTHLEQRSLQDIYIACFCLHNASDKDGLLSMWRGYGADGSGAAIVFNTELLREIPDSPLILGTVSYGSTNSRIKSIRGLCDVFNQCVSNVTFHRTDTVKRNLQILECASQLIERLIMFSVFTKHIGFREEKEYRIVYLRHRDVKNTFTDMLSYSVSADSVVPKFKFRIAPLDGYEDGGLDLRRIVHQIILGPCSSSKQSCWAVRRMLEVLGYPDLAGRVVASSTPYRPAGT